MAKANKKKPAPSKNSKINAAVQELRDYYQLGKKVIEADRKVPGNNTYGKGISSKFAKQIGKKKDYVDKARQFASNYTQEQAEKLIALRRPDGTPFGRRHLVALLSVNDKKERAALQRKAAKDGWSVRRIEEENKRQHGRRSSGGRRPRAADSVENAIAQVIKMSEQWTRWKVGFEGDEEGQVAIGDLPKDVQKQLALVCKQIERLGSLSQTFLEKNR